MNLLLQNWLILAFYFRYSQVRHDGSKRLYIETLNLLRIEYLFNDFISALMVSRLSLSTNPSVCYHKFGFLDSFCELISRFVVDMDYLVNQAMSHTDEGFNKFVSYFSFFRQATMFIKTDITLLGQYSTRITTLLKLLLKVTSQVSYNFILCSFFLFRKTKLINLIVQEFR